MTMRAVGKAAMQMVEEVTLQFNTIPGLMAGLTKPGVRLRDDTLS